MDGPLAPIDCVSIMAHEPCPMEKTCGLRWLWKEVRDSVAEILERTTFADLVEKSGRSKDHHAGDGLTGGPTAKVPVRENGT
jgi:DNA-binding IscR family transcriptional regulator